MRCGDAVATEPHFAEYPLNVFFRPIMSDDRGNDISRTSTPAPAVFLRRQFLTHLTAVAASATGLGACGGGGDGVEVTVGEGGLSFSDNTLTVTVGVPATITIRNQTVLPSGSWSITTPSGVTVSPASGGSVSAGNSVTITVTASAVGNFAVQVKVGVLSPQTLTVSAVPAATPAPTSTPAPTPTPAPTATPAPTGTPAPTPAPTTPAPTPTPTPTPAPTSTPRPTPAPTPAPTTTPAPTPTPTPAPTPAPTPSSTTAPSPTPAPPAVPTPSWLQGVAVNQWIEIPNSSMSTVPAGMPASGTAPSSRMDAWNGYALKGTDVYSVRQGGHGDYYGNEVIRFNAASNTPGWSMIKNSSPESAVTDDSSRYSDGSPAAVHGYHSQRYVPQRDWVLSVGSTAISRLGGTKSDCVVYNVATNAYMPVGTVPDMPAMILAEQGIWDDPLTGDIYHTAGRVINRWNQKTNTWSLRVTEVQNFYGFASVCCTDTTRRRALLLAGDPAARVPQLFTFATQTAQDISCSGDTTIVNSTGHYGMVFCPTTDRFYAMTGGAGSTGLYEINPTTWVISAKTTSGGSQMPAAATTGVFTRFLYVQQLGGIIYFPRYSANAWFLRLH